MGSTLRSKRTGWAAGKPSDEPLRKGETQSPTDLELILPNSSTVQTVSVGYTTGIIFYKMLFFSTYFAAIHS